MDGAETGCPRARAYPSSRKIQNGRRKKKREKEKKGSEVEPVESSLQIIIDLLVDKNEVDRQYVPSGMVLLVLLMGTISDNSNGELLIERS